MRTVHVQELSAEKFGLYGTFADMLHAAGPHIGTDPIEFYRDMTTVYSPCASVGLSITKVYRRPLVIDTYEYHNTCAEAMLPLDGDAYIHVAPAGPADRIPYDAVEVFRVPKGTMVTLLAYGITARSAWIRTPYRRSSFCRNGSMPMTARS